MRMPRSPVPETGKLGDALDNVRISRLLKRYDIGARSLDHLCYLRGAPDTALTNVVGEKAQAYPSPSSSFSGFLSSTRYG